MRLSQTRQDASCEVMTSFQKGGSIDYSSNGPMSIQMVCSNFQSVDKSPEAVNHIYSIEHTMA